MAELPPQSVAGLTINSEEEIHDENASKDTAESVEETKQQRTTDQGTTT